MIQDTSQRLFLCDVPIDPTTPEQLTKRLIAWTGERSTDGQPIPRHISYVNAHVHNLARSHGPLRTALHNTAICYVDGASIVWACRRHGEIVPPRLTAADFLPDVLAAVTRENRRVFLLGGAEGVAERATTALQESVPEFAPAGIHSGYFKSTESPAVIDRIRQANTDLLIVGMGTPQQQVWVDQNLAALNVPVVWTVGALFDYFAGVESRCPAWMGNNGLEWMYRLLMKPRQMAGRYLIGNPKFVAATMRGKLVRANS